MVVASPPNGAPGAPHATPFGTRSDWRILLWSALFGIVMGLIALAFILPIHWAEQVAEGWVEEHPGQLRIATAIAPAIGGVLCAVVGLLLPLSLRGHGVSAVLYAVARLRSALPFRLAVRQWLASTATIVSGGSAGPEGPIVTIGAAIGSTVGRLTRMDRDGVTTLLGAGAAAGIAAVFNAPIAGVFFALEVLLRDFSIRTFAPIVVAAVLSSAATQTILGSRSPLFGLDPSMFADMRERLTVASAPAFALLGVLSGVVAVAFVRVLRTADRLFAGMRLPPFWRPAFGGLLLGGLGLAYLLLDAGAAVPTEVSRLPVFMGNGYGLIQRLLMPETYAIEAAWSLAILLAAWLVLKAIATALTLGSGGAGGLFAPSLLLGALAGGAYGVAVRELGFLPDASPAHYALAGMAGVVAATTHAPLSGMMLAYELTGDYSMILPLMLASTLATLVARSIDRDSAYTGVLSDQGVRLGTQADRTLLRRIAVRDITLAPAVVVHADETAERLLSLIERCAVGELVVVDRDDRFVGLVGGAELRAALVHQNALRLMQVGDLMRVDVPSIGASDTLDVALDRFGDADFATLPVLDERRRVEGLLTRERLMRRYHDELERDA